MDMASKRHGLSRIAILMPRDYRFGREIILGVAKYCMTHGVKLLHLGTSNPEEIGNPHDYEVGGVISYLATPSAVQKFKSWNVPLVTTSSRFAETNVPSVQADNVKIGRLGAEHLLNRGFRNLAFCGIKDHWYSILRAKGFNDAATEAGVETSKADDVFVDVKHDPSASSMAHWLRALKRPAGVMACNDIRSRHVMECCLAVGLKIPDDIAVVGVDNDEVICQGMDPMVSSVDPNAYKIGYEAAAMLSRMIDKKAVEQTKLIAPLGVVPRASTYTTAVDDPMIATAMSLIHGRSESPLSVGEIARRMKLSRRTLERKFRQMVGASVATAIRRAHVERAKQLLIDTDLSLEEVADAAGLKYVRQLRIAFQRETGHSPTHLRRAFLKAN